MIIYACPDLIFATKVRATAEALGIGSRPTRDLEALRKRLRQEEDGKLNEKVTGVVIDLGLGPAALELIAAVKEHDAGLPVVAYGSHVATEALAAAKAKGADFVMANSQFAGNLPAILKTLAKRE